MKPLFSFLLLLSWLRSLLRSLLLTWLLLLASMGRAATIYQCASPTGRAIFSDQPCGTDAKVQELASPPLMHSDMAVSPERQKVLNQELAQQLHQQHLNRIDNAIGEVRQQMSAARRWRDRSLDDLDRRELSAQPGDRAGLRVARNRIKRSYRNKNDALKLRLKALQKDRRQAERY